MNENRSLPLSADTLLCEMIRALGATLYYAEGRAVKHILLFALLVRLCRFPVSASPQSHGLSLLPHPHQRMQVPKLSDRSTRKCMIHNYAVSYHMMRQAL
jgi:hypothetical protein